ncbi:MAG TPA: DUF5668 domain-containing protein [Thermoanaerobaculia bacterium]|nr:DUF5668 domain-containing protein [Thermoanaerobaculia bacterium]
MEPRPDSPPTPPRRVAGLFFFSPRLIVGLCILAFGTLLLLDRLDLFYARDFLHTYWPAILVLAGIARLASPGCHSPVVSLALIFVGGWLLLDHLGIVVFNARVLWPLALVLVGLSLVFGELTRRRVRGPAAGGGAAASAASDVSALAVLGGASQSISAQDFRGGTATAILGSCRIDLRQAAIAGDEAVIDTFAFWGGVDILVPDGWEVVLRGIPLLGGFDDRTEHRAGAPPDSAAGRTQRLVVKGVAIMGGVDIRNKTRRDRDR